VVGLYPFAPENSALVRKVQIEADNEVESSMESQGMKYYSEHLAPVDKLRFVTHLYAEAFVNNYVNLTASKSSEVRLDSPEQPGFFQQARQSRIAMAQGFVGKATTKILRLVESPWANNAYGLGFTQWRHRNLPFYRDGSAAVIYRLRTFIGYATAMWASQYYIWQAKFPWTVYVFFVLTATVLVALKSWLDRTLINLNYPPLNKVWYKMLYGVVWTWLSYFDYVPFFFFKDDFVTLFDQYIGTPLSTTWDFLSAIPDKVSSACRDLLGKPSP
jgi:hypothetical protein